MTLSSEKTLIVIRSKENYRSFSQRLLEQAAALSRRSRIGSCKLALTAQAPPPLSVIPYKRKPAALLTLEGAGGVPLTARECRNIAETIEGVSGCYRGDCVLPVAYEKSWDDGAVTPGCGLLTLFRRRRDLDYETFLDKWHNGHTPLSLEIHPLWNYVRNVITEKILEPSEDFDGIVEEHFKDPRDLTRLLRFFGGFTKIAGNMAAVYRDSRGFIDMKTIEPYFVTEYWLKSETGASGSI